MGPLDTDTLLSVYLALSGLTALFTLAGGWTTRKPGLWLWSGAFMASLLSQAIRPEITELWGVQASKPPGHLGGVLQALLVLAGMRAFLGLRISWLGIAAVFAAVAVFSFTLLATGQTLWWSLSVTQAVAGLAMARAAWLAWQARRSGGSGALGLMGAVLGAAALVALARAVSVLPIGMSTARLNVANEHWLMATLLLVVAEGFAMLVLVNSSLRDELAKLADFDPLTGLLNRRGLRSRLERIMQAPIPQHARPDMAVAVLDLDEFKGINDRFGHQVGDEVLAEVARRLHAGSGPGDLVARTGGEEFMLIWTAAGSQAGTVGEQIRALVAGSPVPSQVGDVGVTTSVGIATGPWQGNESFEGLVRRADHALYAAKRGGRNRVVQG
ncbi:GGDEF domain-containing protein [Dyella lutea]|uniref:diguanylate cyclase n=1 Tax=Dyella lutea TaxID=2950441 RepID=A0ABT1F8J8_9GAMM|nr:GGDEF domain-containing protein [Dyella lutea]MCP1373703.1 GGDEF domain-containing protein [Dyella lutea]